MDENEENSDAAMEKDMDEMKIKDDVRIFAEQASNGLVRILRAGLKKIESFTSQAKEFEN